MHDISQDDLVFCEECGNALHTECFGQCSFTPPFLSINTDRALSSLSGRRRAAEVTCVWCRAKWTSGAESGTSAKPTSSKYINLGGIAGLSGERDKSSCALLSSFAATINDASCLRPSRLAVLSWQEQGVA
jgi:hypothetical protein